jgi:hypothetical protein
VSTPRNAPTKNARITNATAIRHLLVEVVPAERRGPQGLGSPGSPFFRVSPFLSFGSPPFFAARTHPKSALSEADGSPFSGSAHCECSATRSRPPCGLRRPRRCIFAGQRGKTTSLPSWWCGFDSRRPLRWSDVASPGQRRFRRTVFLRGATRRHASFPGRPRDGRGTSARRSAEELEPLLRPDRHERLQDRGVLRRQLDADLVQRPKRCQLAGLMPATLGAALLV